MSKIRTSTCVVLSTVIMFLSLGTGAQVPAVFNRILPILKAAEQNAPKADSKIWPGFEFEKTPIFIWDADSGQGLLLNTSSIPKGFTQPFASMPRVALGPIPPGTTPADAVMPVVDRLAAWLNVQALTSAKDQATAVGVLYRSAFDVFEPYQNFVQASPLSSGTYPYLNANANALAMAENRLLAKMVGAGQSQAAPLLAAFLQIRQKRQALLPPAIANYEWTHEVDDGISQYAAYQAMAVSARAEAEQDLIKQIESFKPTQPETEATHWAFSGCALALALDETGKDWKVMFQKGSRDSLEPVIEEVTKGVTPADTAFLDMSQLQKQAEEAVQEIKSQQQNFLDQILKADGLIVKLNLTGVIGNHGIKWSNRYSTKDVYHLGDGREIRNSYYQLKGQGFLTCTSGRPLLIIVRKSMTVGFSKDHMPWVKVDGKQAGFKKGVTTLTGKVEIRGDRYELAISDARLDFDAASHTLTVTPLPEEASGAGATAAQQQ